MHEFLMQRAIAMAYEGKYCQDGGPFGAVIAKDNKVICSVHNIVSKNNDITLHTELYAISEASKKLDSKNLSDCVLYTSCEPCMMCLGACHWADFKEIYYGASANDAKLYGFEYSRMYYASDHEARHEEFRMKQLLRDEALAVWL